MTVGCFRSNGTLRGNVSAGSKWQELAHLHSLETWQMWGQWAAFQHLPSSEPGRTLRQAVGKNRKAAPRHDRSQVKRVKRASNFPIFSRLSTFEPHPAARWNPMQSASFRSSRTLKTVGESRNIASGWTCRGTGLPCVQTFALRRSKCAGRRKLGKKEKSVPRQTQGQVRREKRASNFRYSSPRFSCFTARRLRAARGPAPQTAPRPPGRGKVDLPWLSLDGKAEGTHDQLIIVITSLSSERWAARFNGGAGRSHHTSPSAQQAGSLSRYLLGGSAGCWGC